MFRGDSLSPTTAVADERFAFTWRGAAGLIAALGVAGVVIVGFGSAVGGRSETRAEIDLALRENVALRAQQEALRKQAFELAERSIEAVEQAQRIARLSGADARNWEGEGSPLPARNGEQEAILDWLSQQQALLAAVDEGLSGPLRNSPTSATTAGAARTASTR